jgi:diguanylate cyclase (GGDEF)-like protein
MGERQPTAPFDLPSEELIPAGDAWRSHLPKTDRVMWAMRAVGLLVLSAAVGWTLLGGHLVSSKEQKVLEVVAILVAAASAIFIAAYTQRRNVDMERAYSSHLEALSRHLRYLAYRDFLTGLYNHRYFQEQLAHEVERAQRYGHQLSVLMLDVDRFKQVNDTYGHLMGDTLLSYVARLVSAKVRSSDVAARYGGDEFAVILPETDQEKAIAVAEKLRKAVSADRHWQGALLGNLGVGICFGVASFPDDGRTADDLLVCADRRLYSAKGRRPRLVHKRKKLVSPLSGLQAG